MLLSRLRIRGKLAALIVLPLLIIVGLSAGIAISQVRQAGAAGNTARSVDVGSAVGLIVADLQSERLQSVGYLSGQASLSDVVSSASEVDEQVTDLEAQYGSGLTATVRTALSGIARLVPLRNEVAAKSVAPPAVLAGYHTVIGQLIDATRLVDNIDTGSSAGREVVALDSLLHIDELTNESAAILLELAGDNTTPAGPNAAALVAYSADQTSIGQLLPRFTGYATSSEIGLHDLVDQAFQDRLGPDFTASFASSPVDTATTLSPTVLYPQMESFVVLGRFAEQKTAADVVSSVQSQRSEALAEAYLAAALGLLVVVAVAVGGAVIARSVAVPLATLTASTNRVARLAEGELLRVADDEMETTEPIAFDPVHVTTDDEIGELARAFERISRTSVQLVGRQVASRRNVAQMFGHVGRRTQNLVGRQITLIDALESQETDARRLGDLYRLDHLTSRLRRNASSLVALSGTPDQGSYFAPLALVDVIRLGLGEIEEYTRVDVAAPGELMIAPSAINDAVLLLAELMENATTFSPPHTRVTITGLAHPGRVTIVDHGIGLPAERLAEENARLAQRERLDLAPTEVLGLFVVGRLARRHGLGVILTSTPGGGVTVTVDIASILIAAGPAALTSTPVPAAAPAPVSSAPVLVAATASVPNGSRELSGQQLSSQHRPDYSDAQSLFDDADGLFDLESLGRATHAIESGRPWNAFELPQPALPAGPSRPATEIPAEFDPTVPDVRPLATPPDAHTGRWPVEPMVMLEWASADTGPLPIQPVAQPVAQPAIPLPRPGSDRARTPFDASAGTESQTIAMPVPPGGLTRRVPGATIRMDQPSTTRQNVRPQDPDEVWDLIQQFESGVARALDEVGSDATEEDATR